VKEGLQGGCAAVVTPYMGVDLAEPRICVTCSFLL